ncbi:MAG: type II toxin-antitoxin system mRNA interferase toxin, RelE/StbE family [Acidobacteria bacterium]|nr:MAG: type II toxin-antitoxin system mRNA interferase toxin, RelE/StbE family [Acidobacteriota bacterium]PYY16475.1 MAG: type II toxin-antitoxin system mRNA interferase toxin, RelE/StbE family [Acidobacteriota bacterium]
MKVLWTSRATQQLHAAYDYWSAEHSPQAGDRMLERILSAVQMLEKYPDAGRHGRIPGTREIVIPRTPFLIPYRLQHDKVQILAILHGARKWPENL